MPKVIIVGGGLSGLALAHHLNQSNVDFHLLEARNRLGGRIKGLRDGNHTFDLGPSWYWPGQPSIARLSGDLGLTTFKQHAIGDLIFETEQGQVQRGAGFASMEGSLRIQGGMPALIDGLAATLTPDCIFLSSQVTRIEKGKGVVLTSGEVLEANKFVVTCPPRVAANIEYIPAINTDPLMNIPTWMGGQAKFVATYESPFWRAEGLSGDAMSRHGPLVEIHDASPMDASLGALFGFVGVPPDIRHGQADAVIAAALKQLTRLFGEDAGTPRIAHLEDWAVQPETAAPADQTPLMAHPEYGLHRSLDNLWGGSLHFGSTETANDFGGFLEGALVRAETLASRLIS